MHRQRGGSGAAPGHGHQQHHAHTGRRPQHHGPHGDGKDREPDGEGTEISAAEQEALRAAVLAGFRMPEREKGVSARGRRRPAPRDADKRLISEDQYTQASFSFVLKPGDSYAQYQANPDEPVPWSAVVQVIGSALSEAEATCPICLDTPRAARMARCGHVFCWVCALRMLHQKGAGSGQCPVCFRAMAVTELRSFRAAPLTVDSMLGTTAEPVDPLSLRVKDALKDPTSLSALHFNAQTNSECISIAPPKTVPLQFQLCRVQGAAVLPVAATCPDGIPMVDVPYGKFCRLLIACPAYVRRMYLQDLDELHIVLADLAEEEAAVLATAAVLAAAPVTAAAEGAVSKQQGQTAAIDAMRFHADAAVHEITALLDGVMDTPATSTVTAGPPPPGFGVSAGGDSRLSGAAPAFVPRMARPPSMDSADSGEADGAYGSYDRFPPLLEAPAVEFEVYTLSSALRKRRKYLSHIPLLSRVILVEVVLDGLVPATAIAEVAEEVAARAKARKSHVRARSREQAAAQAAEQRALDERKAMYAALGPQLYPALGGRPQVPTITAEDDAAAVVRPDDAAAAAVPVLQTAGEQWSFARVIQVGGVFPTLASTMGGPAPAAAAAAPTAPKTAWGTTAASLKAVAAPASPPLPPQAAAASAPPMNALHAALVRAASQSEEPKQRKGRKKATKKGDVDYMAEW